MDYGKYTYLKLAELEEEYISKERELASNSAEFSQPLINGNILGSFVIDIGCVTVNGKAKIEDELTISASTSGNVIIKLLANGVVIYSEEKTLSSGNNDIKLTTQILFNKVNVNFQLEVDCNSLYSATIKSNNFVITGKISELKNSQNSPMRLLNLNSNNQILISNTINNNIYYMITNKSSASFVPSDFTFAAAGISHSFAINKANNNIYLFRVDENNNLYYRLFVNGSEETLIDTNVTDVYARRCPDSLTEDMLVCYIKNKQPYYCTITNTTISASRPLPAPSAKYKAIFVPDSGEFSCMFVVATTESENNYILRSLDETNLSEFAEVINANSAILVRRVVKIDPEFANNAENVSVNSIFNISADYLNFESLLSSNAENAKLNISAEISSYRIAEDIPDVLYQFQFWVKEKYSSARRAINCYNMLYDNSAINWTFSTIDYSNTGEYLDSGNLMDKWPFNLIKPCLVSNGQVVGYLDPNDYSKFVDGTNADIYSGNYDVMVQFPKIYYQFDYNWDGNCTVSGTASNIVKVNISSTPRDGYVCYSHMKGGVEYDYIYVGAYECSISGGKLFCCSGKAPSVDIPHSQVVKNISNFRNSEYTTMNYHFTTYLYLLELLMFGERCPCYSIGEGMVGAVSEIKNSGTLDNFGLFYGVGVSNSAEKHTMKLFGLENIMGNSKTYVDGVLYTSDGKFLIYDPTNPNCVLNTKGQNYVAYEFNLPKTYYYAYTAMCAINNNYGFLPVQTLVSSTNKGYYGAYTKVAPPSYYNGYDAQVSGAEVPHMLFFYGGDYSRYRGMTITADVDYSESNTNFSERIMCYPTNKISR